MLRHFVPLALAAALGSGTTCTSETAGPPKPETGGTQSMTRPVSAEDEQKCVDAWLEKNKMDPYGNPAGTMYMGGTPLFDEASGKATDRVQFIYQNHPEAKAACAPK